MSANHSAAASASSHPISLDEVPYRQAKASLKEIEAAGRRAFGHVLARCIDLAGLIHKEAAARMGIDPATLARWVSGLENAQCWRFHQDELLGPALIAAQAEVTEGAIVRTVIELRRKVG